MIPQNKFDKTGECQSRGQIAEDLFKKIMESKGNKVRPTSKKEQFSNMGDFYVTLDGKETLFEIKGQKKLQRQNIELTALIWVELQKINGTPGFLFGNFEKLAFQDTAVSFIVVDRKELQEFVEKNLKHEYVKSVDESSVLKLYKRFGRDDLLTLVTKKHLFSLPSHYILCF